MTVEDRVAAWREAGVVDEATADRIRAYEAARAGPEPGPRDRIGAAEVVAYIGAVILLVGIGFLYGTQYAVLGTAGRLILVGAVIAAGLGIGRAVGAVGSEGAARRARAAGWAIAAIAVAVWSSQLLADNHILTNPAEYNGPGEDASGSIMLGSAIGLAAALGLLWRAGSGLLAAATALLTFALVIAFAAHQRPSLRGWAAEATVIAGSLVLVAVSEALTRGHERRWAREVLRFAAILPAAVAALGFSSQVGSLEPAGAAIALLGFGLAFARASAGYAIAAGIALFIVVTEVGFRHFASSVGFPVVLIVSGIVLLALAAGLFKVLPRLRRAAVRP